MSFQTVFKRYELKYILTVEQKKKVLEAMAPHMQLDAYGRTTIRNIYYDTEDYRLIRQSIEKPVYKEKLRVRSYARVTKDQTVFVELKKKYEALVYKRRLALKVADAEKWLGGEQPCSKYTQISGEIDSFLDFYRTLHPVAFLSYEREAYFTEEDPDFRVTFDDTILYRAEALSLTEPVYGTPILPEGMVLMEIKCAGAIPLWMVSVLSEQSIYKTSYSKYGTAYQTLIFPKIKKQISGGY